MTNTDILKVFITLIILFTWEFSFIKIGKYYAKVILLQCPCIIKFSSLFKAFRSEVNKTNINTNGRISMTVDRSFTNKLL